MNITTLLPHLCDIKRNNVPVTDNANRDIYRQPRVAPKVVISQISCVFDSNIARNLFTTDVLKSAGSVLATVLLDGSILGPDGIHTGDVITNITDKRGNVVSTHDWFAYRISQFSDKTGNAYTQVMVARDEAGPRN